MNREPGYYWVKRNRRESTWQIAFYIPSLWRLTGTPREYIDRDFDKIDERRIERPTEPLK